MTEALIGYTGARMTTELGGEAVVTAPSASTDARGGASVVEIRDGIRDDIIAGRLAPGVALSSAKLSKDYGVSRTPLREAVRMLQEEGFLTLQNNQRPRVTTWSPDELESVFVQRILLISLCTSLTVPLMSSEDIAEMERTMGELDEAEAAHDHERWREADVQFHRVHTRRAPKALIADLERLSTRASDVPLHVARQSALDDVAGVRRPSPNLQRLLRSRRPACRGCRCPALGHRCHHASCPCRPSTRAHRGTRGTSADQSGILITRVDDAVD